MITKEQNPWWRQRAMKSRANVDELTWETEREILPAEHGEETERESGMRRKNDLCSEARWMAGKHLTLQLRHSSPLLFLWYWLVRSRTSGLRQQAGPISHSHLAPSGIHIHNLTDKGRTFLFHTSKRNPNRLFCELLSVATSPQYCPRCPVIRDPQGIPKKMKEEVEEFRLWTWWGVWSSLNNLWINDFYENFQCLSSVMHVALKAWVSQGPNSTFGNPLEYVVLGIFIASLFKGQFIMCNGNK